MSSETRQGGRTESGSDLPAVEQVRTQATVAGRDAVVIRFESGARLRYVATETAVREEWFAPDDEEPRRTTEREPPLCRAALDTLGEYLSFDDRAHASFVWGAGNVEVIAP
ncbi:hypothetical protein BRC72_01570 [Halobacteriales archaeon QH_7_66_36]|nr:MAG: hypothetical protein BRC72_01570 [Halobacteriales archaeon QH_7_66_36]